MKLNTPYERFFEKFSTFFSTGIRLLLNVLLVIIVAGLALGVYKAGVDVFGAINKPLEDLLQSLLLDTIFIVAMVEITITILSYLRDGYVHVRYIVDTILIVMLNEVVTIWLKDPSVEKAVGISVILATLAAIRVSVVKFAPAASIGKSK